MSVKPMTLQIHFPFCPGKCGYCDRFTLEEVSVSQREQYIQALIREMAATAPEISDYEITSVCLKGCRINHFGGPILKELLDNLYHLLPMHPDAEIVMEVAPVEISAAFLESLRRFPHLRFHMEQATLDPYLRETLFQYFPPGACRDSLPVFEAMRMPNVGVSLLYGIQGQGLPSLQTTLEEVLSLGASSVSLRPLRLSDGTLVRKIYDKQRTAQEAASKTPSSPALSPRHIFPDAGKRKAFFREGRRLLKEHGLKEQTWHNFYREGFFSRLIDDRMNAVDELGLGLGAVSFFDGISYQNTRNLSLYLSSSGDYEKIMENPSQVSARKAAWHALYRGLANPEGIRVKAFRERFGMAPQDANPALFIAGRERHLFRETDELVGLTEEGAFMYEASSLPVFGPSSPKAPHPEGGRIVRK